MSAPSSDDGFAETLAARLTGYGAGQCIEFAGTWHTGHDIDRYRSAINRALRDAGVGPTGPVGLVVRNRVPHAAAVLDFVARRRPVSMIYSYQSAQAIAADIRALRPPAILADIEDFTPPLLQAVRETGCAAVAFSSSGPTVQCVAGRGPAIDATTAQPGLSLLTSGTTGPPKRMPIPTAVLRHTVASMTLGRAAAADDPPALVFWPFGSVGVCQLLAGAYSGQRIVLLEKFTVQEWVAAVRTHRIRWTGVQPTVVRMLLEADVPRSDLASLEYLPGGSGPLEPELQRAFEDKYGIPLLWGYGATEFAGTVCSWTPDLRHEFGDTKPGSVGRTLPGVQVRIVDPETRLPVPTSGRGLLTARLDILGPDWIETTDIASMDADGFITVHGRADGAINRGGFKILPDRVRAALLAHPDVRDACVVPVADARLGQVPFAAVEIRTAGRAPSENELKDIVRELLPAHNVPVAIHVVEQLPRNAAMKVRLDAVAALYDSDRIRTGSSTDVSDLRKKFT
ncbi:MAG: AMP-binding protein [Mycobacterium sp.]|nr:AMP-binding protein [Mycobacterium sp.]